MLSIARSSYWYFFQSKIKFKNLHSKIKTREFKLNSQQSVNVDIKLEEAKRWRIPWHIIATVVLKLLR